MRSYLTTTTAYPDGTVEITTIRDSWRTVETFKKDGSRSEITYCIKPPERKFKPQHPLTTIFQ